MEIDLTIYDKIFTSISAGKDSMCILMKTVEMAKKQNVLERVIAVYSDIGADWTQSYDLAKTQCNLLNVPLERVFSHRSFPDYLEARMMFPSMKCRYCTGLKTSAIDKFIRKLYPAKVTSKVLVVTGERAEESPKRAKLQMFESFKRLNAGNRQVFSFRPILYWSTKKVWQTIHASKIPYHIAYDLGNERLSCALCVFASDKDLRNGAKNRPDLAQRFIEVERKSGFTFRHNRSLESILNEDENKSLYYQEEFIL